MQAAGPSPTASDLDKTQPQNPCLIVHKKTLITARIKEIAQNKQHLSTEQLLQVYFQETRRTCTTNFLPYDGDSRPSSLSLSFSLFLLWCLCPRCLCLRRPGFPSGT